MRGRGEKPRVGKTTGPERRFPAFFNFLFLPELVTSSPDSPADAVYRPDIHESSRRVIDVFRFDHTFRPIQTNPTNGAG
jgi:hypothetical protein